MNNETDDFTFYNFFIVKLFNKLESTNDTIFLDLIGKTKSQVLSDFVEYVLLDYKDGKEGLSIEETEKYRITLDYMAHLIEMLNK